MFHPQPSPHPITIKRHSEHTHLPFSPCFHVSSFTRSSCRNNKNTTESAKKVPLNVFKIKIVVGVRETSPDWCHDSAIAQMVLDSRQLTSLSNLFCTSNNTKKLSHPQTQQNTKRPKQRRLFRYPHTNQASPLHACQPLQQALNPLQTITPCIPFTDPLSMTRPLLLLLLLLLLLKVNPNPQG
jgi:hypothetical protein